MTRDNDISNTNKPTLYNQDILESQKTKKVESVLETNKLEKTEKKDEKLFETEYTDRPLDQANTERKSEFDEDITLREILLGPEPTGPGSVEMLDPIHHDPLLQNASHHFTQSELQEQAELELKEEERERERERELEQKQEQELELLRKNFEYGETQQPQSDASGHGLSLEENTRSTEVTASHIDTTKHISSSYKEIRSKEATVTAVAGALSGLLSGILACPLDVTKTRLQAQGIQRAENLYYRGIFGTMSTIIRDEGFGALYKGVGPIVLGYFSTWMIYFSIYDSSKKYWTSKFPNWNFVSHSCSAISAGAVSATLTNPIWVVKTRLMLQTDMGTSKVHYSGTLDAFRKIVSQEGVRALYTGLLPSLLGLAHVAIHFPVYEKLKVKFHCYDNPSSHSPTITDDKSHKTKNGKKQNSSLHVGRLIMASSISKMLASLVTYPHEILRTRMQLRPDPETARANPHKMIPLLKTTYKNEGFRGLYSGFGANLFRTVPTSAMTLVSFEYIYNFLSGV